MFVAQAQQVKNFLKNKKKIDHVITLMYMWCGFVTDGSFVTQRESHFRLHCAIQVQNH